MKIGYIGLGSLGTPLAENLLQSGHELYVYNRTASKTKPLADKGAKVSATIADLAKECDIVFTMVSDDAALNAVSAELLQHLRKGSLHISMTTILPQTAADLHAAHAAKGLHYLPFARVWQAGSCTCPQNEFRVVGKCRTQEKSGAALS